MPFAIRIKVLLGFVIALFLVALSTDIVVRVKAKEPAQSVLMDIAPAFQGYFKYGEWLPVWIKLENNGNDLEGEVQIRIVRDFDQTIFSTPVSLPSGANKRLPLYIQPNNFTHEIKVDFVSNDEILQTKTATVHPQPNINYIIGIASSQRGALSLVPSIQLPGGRLPVLVDISLKELPDRPESLRSLNCLVLNDIDTSSLSPEQINALLSWIQSGGRLVIGGGVGALQTTSGLPDNVIPLQPEDLAELKSVDSLENFSNSTPVRIPGPFLISKGNTQQGETLVQQDGFPLVQEISYGGGFITFVALDLAISPFDAWAGTADFWETILTPGAAYPNWMPPDMSEQQMKASSVSNALFNIPNLDLPSAKTIVILLSIYILLVGPINYLLLRWRKRLHWGWITIPVITLAFSALSFGLGYAKRGTDLIINKISIIQGQLDGSAQVVSYIGLFSPANLNYELSITGESLLSPMTNYYSPWMSSMPPSGNSGGSLTFVQGNPSLVRGLNVNQWSMQSFMTETSMDNIGPIEANLQLENQNLVGTITNKTGFPINDAVVILKHNFVRLGDISSDETVNITMKLEQGEMYGTTMSWKIYEDQYDPSMIRTPQREIEFKRMVLESILDQQYMFGVRSFQEGLRTARELTTSPDVTFIGWMDVAHPEIRINDKSPQETATSLYKIELSYQYPENGAYVIPAGLIPGLIIEMPISGGTCGLDNASIWIDQGDAVVEFKLPAELLNTNIENLQFLIQTDSGFTNPPNIDIYDWTVETWLPLNNAVMGINIISDTANHINAEGLVRFQISPENQDFRGGSCYYTGLGLKSNS